MSATVSEVPELSVVVPVKDEAENLKPLIEEICVSLNSSDTDYEIVYVDDGSVDSTAILLKELILKKPRLRVIRHPTCFGQSAAIVTGVSSARGNIIATIDGDGQNDPKDLLLLLERYRHEMNKRDYGTVMVVGHRVMRKDRLLKRYSSRIANSIRRRILEDSAPDTGCSLKVFSRAAFMALPHFDHMHRFLPALIIRGGGRVLSVPVSHRARERGISKYGIWDRLLAGIVDLFGVMWLVRRSLRTITEEKNRNRE